MTESFEYNRTHNTLNPRVALATAASIIGLVSIALVLSAYFAILLGGVALVMALLSRDTDGKLLPQAKRGIVFGLVGLIGGYAIMIQAFVMIFTDPQTHAMVNQYSEAIGGPSFDDMINEIQNSLGIKLSLPAEDL